MEIFSICKYLLKVNNKDTRTKTLDTYWPILPSLIFREVTVGTEYSRMDQVKFVEYSLNFIWSTLEYFVSINFESTENNP